MPKTKDAFALRGFDDEKIWKRPIFSLPKDDDNVNGLHYGLKGVDDNLTEKIFEFYMEQQVLPKNLREKVTDNFLIEKYYEAVIEELQEDQYGYAKYRIDDLQEILSNVKSYEQKLIRHRDRLNVWLGKFEERIISDETLSAEQIRKGTRRIHMLLKSYTDALQAVRKFVSEVKKICAEAQYQYETIYRKTFSVRLREARIKARLTQSEVSQRLGMTQGGYTQYEQARREPTLATLCRLSKVLKCPTDWLLGME